MSETPSAEKGAPNYRLWWEQSEHRRAEVEEVLDLVLGTDEDDGMGAGLVADVLLAIQKAWDEGYTSGHSNAMRRMSDEPNAPTTPNPYRAALATSPTEHRCAAMGRVEAVLSDPLLRTKDLRDGEPAATGRHCPIDPGSSE